MSRWYDFYERLSPLFESLQFMDSNDLEVIAHGVMKLTKVHKNDAVFSAIIENMGKERPHRRWYDRDSNVAMIYYSLEESSPDFIDVVTNFLDEHVPPSIKILGEEVSQIYRVADAPQSYFVE